MSRVQLSVASTCGVLAAMWLAPVTGAAQSLMVASSAVVVDDRTNTGTITLVNDGVAPVEANIGTFYGYPVTDAIGNMYLRTFPDVHDTMPSAASWIQSFPRRLRIEPKSRAVVRLLVSPPANLPRGEYWARVVVAAKVGRVPVRNLPAKADIRASLDLEVRSVVGLFYRVGTPATGVELRNLRVEHQGDSLVGRVVLSRQGNAAFVGSLRVRLRDAKGRVAAERLLPLGVYYELDPRFTLPVAGLTGRYELVAEAVAHRPDLAPDLLLPAPPATLSTSVELP